MRDNSIVYDFYALATRWTVHTKIDSWVIFTYFEIFGFMVIPVLRGLKKFIQKQLGSPSQK